MFKELGFIKVAKISEARKERLRSAKPTLTKTKTIKKLEKGESIAPKVTKSRDGWIPGDQSKITTPIKKGLSDAKAYVKPKLQKVKAFSKDYVSGNQGYLPGDQTKFKANVKKTYSKVKSFAKDYFSGNQGYIPGNQSNIKSRIKSVAQDWKSGRSGYIPGDQSKIRESITGFFKGKKKKKNISVPPVIPRQQGPSNFYKKNKPVKKNEPPTLFV
tara:strand:+ start:217 stop:861 length:645 start_codon:yes stop_codon:yes gene_type:complete